MRKFCLAAAAMLSGCAANPTPIRPLKPLELATAPYTRASSEALTGSLAYENSCLSFRDDDSERQLVPVWPVGSSFNGTELVFHSPGNADQQLVVAEHFVMTGRSLAWSALDATTYAPFASQCGGEPFLVTRIRPAD